jgi:hypothetical protein
MKLSPSLFPNWVKGAVILSANLAVPRGARGVGKFRLPARRPSGSQADPVQIGPLLLAGRVLPEPIRGFAPLTQFKAIFQFKEFS